MHIVGQHRTSSPGIRGNIGPCEYCVGSLTCGQIEPVEASNPTLIASGVQWFTGVMAIAAFGARACGMRGALNSAGTCAVATDKTHRISWITLPVPTTISARGGCRAIKPRPACVSLTGLLASWGGDTLVDYMAIRNEFPSRRNILCRRRCRPGCGFDGRVDARSGFRISASLPAKSGAATIGLRRAMSRSTCFANEWARRALGKRRSRSSSWFTARPFHRGPVSISRSPDTANTP